MDVTYVGTSWIKKIQWFSFTIYINNARHWHWATQQSLKSLRPLTLVVARCKQVLMPDAFVNLPVDKQKVSNYCVPSSTCVIQCSELWVRTVIFLFNAFYGRRAITIMKQKFMLAIETIMIFLRITFTSLKIMCICVNNLLLCIHNQIELCSGDNNIIIIPASYFLLLITFVHVFV